MSHMKEGYPEALPQLMRNEVEAHKDVKWRIATFHKTMFTGSKSHQSDKDEVRERAKMLPVFNELNIDLALQGHDHIYEVIGPVNNDDKTLIMSMLQAIPNSSISLQSSRIMVWQAAFMMPRPRR